MPKLGINIDHVATLRQARKEGSPDPIAAALVAEKSGADTIVCHLREDRRHIQDDDIKQLKKVLSKPLNLEMSLNKDIIDLALRIKPKYCMFVPEKRQEVTTEGGLNVVKYFQRLKEEADVLNKKGIVVSVFIDPINRHIDVAKEAGCKVVELHTGCYANAKTHRGKEKELKKIYSSAEYAKKQGFIVHAGHGLQYDDVYAVAKIPYIDELNIGHSVIAHAVFHGLAESVRKMKNLVKG